MSNSTFQRDVWKLTCCLYAVLHSPLQKLASYLLGAMIQSHPNSSKSTINSWRQHLLSLEHSAVDRFMRGFLLSTGTMSIDGLYSCTKSKERRRREKSKTVLSRMNCVNKRFVWFKVSYHVVVNLTAKRSLAALLSSPLIRLLSKHYLKKIISFDVTLFTLYSDKREIHIKYAHGMSRKSSFTWLLANNYSMCLWEDYKCKCSEDFNFVVDILKSTHIRRRWHLALTFHSTAQFTHRSQIRDVCRHNLRLHYWTSDWIEHS